METKVIPFQAEHLINMDKAVFDVLGLTEDWLEKAKLFPQIGKCFSAFAGDTLVASAGINVLWPGVGEAWAVITPNVFSHRKLFHRAVKEGLEYIIKTDNLSRVQATVIYGFKKGTKWIERLGFEREGLMRKYDRKENDYWLYAKVRD